MSLADPAPSGRAERAAARARDLLDSPELRRLVARRWTVSLVLTAALFAAYYGFILLVAYDKQLLARRIGAATTLGIPLGVGVILVAWVLAALYVRWATRVWDPATKRLVSGLHRDPED